MTDDQLKRLLEQNNAALFGQLAAYFDIRFKLLTDDLADRTDRVHRTVDSIANRLDTDEHERAAINMEQERQNGWIAQVAKATNTKLVPEQG